MSGVLITPSCAVPLSAIAEAALEACGAEQTQLETGELITGIRVPAQAAGRVRQRAQVLAGAPDDAPARPEDGCGCGASSVTTTAAPPGLGRGGAGCDSKAQHAARAAQHEQQGAS